MGPKHGGDRVIGLNDRMRVLGLVLTTISRASTCSRSMKMLGLRVAGVLPGLVGTYLETRAIAVPGFICRGSAGVAGVVCKCMKNNKMPGCRGSALDTFGIYG